MTNINIYDREYLKSTLYLLQAEANDLSTWDAHNGDILNEEQDELQKIITKIKKRMVYE